MSKPLLAVDLDGTLYNGSSLRQFYIFGARCAIHKGDLTTLMIIIREVLAEKTGIKTHRESKHRVVKRLTSMLTPTDIDRFVNILCRGLNPLVMDMVKSAGKDGYVTLLTTASPDTYSIALAEKLGFDHCQATSTTPEANDYIENRGEMKCKGVTSLSETHGYRLMQVITDHSDDIPLLKLNTTGTNHIINPSPQTLARLKSADVAFTTIR